MFVYTESKPPSNANLMELLLFIIKSYFILRPVEFFFCKIIITIVLLIIPFRQACVRQSLHNIELVSAATPHTLHIHTYVFISSVNCANNFESHFITWFNHQLKKIYNKHILHSKHTNSQPGWPTVEQRAELSKFNCSFQSRQQ